MKLKELLNNEKFLSKYGDYETVGDLYMAVRENDKLQLVFDIQEPKPKTVWDLKNEDVYFFIATNGDVKGYEWNDFYYGECEVGNAFLTKKDAEREVERRKVETLLLKHGGRRWFRMGSICNYYMWVNTGDSLVVGYTGVGMQGLIYFDTCEKAEKAIKEIGEQRIKEALFEVR